VSSLKSPSVVVNALRIEGGTAREREERLAEETAVAFTYNGVSHAVMMASPCDLEDLALGFSLTEGIIDAPHELLELEVVPQGEGISLDMRITELRRQRLAQSRRALTGPTGCGLCGAESVAQAMRTLPAVRKQAPVDSAMLLAAMARLEVAQRLNAETGAVHAAGLLRGDTLKVREDVGRHNALDKVIGAWAMQRGSQGGVLLMSSRLSYEIVAKAAFAQIPVVVGVSAPTALAQRLAQQCGITLAGFARDDRLTVYAHPDGIVATHR